MLCGSIQSGQVDKMREGKDFIFGDTRLLNFLNIAASEKELVRSWRNNLKVRKWMHGGHIISKREHGIFLKRIKTDKNNFWWLVYSVDSPIGVTYLTRCDFHNKSAYLGLYTNPCLKGAGKVLMEALKKIAFGVFKLHSLRLEVLSNNDKAIGFYKKQGFKEEGRLKDCVLRNGKWIDILVMGILGKDSYEHIKPHGTAGI